MAPDLLFCHGLLQAHVCQALSSEDISHGRADRGDGDESPRVGGQGRTLARPEGMLYTEVEPSNALWDEDGALPV